MKNVAVGIIDYARGFLPAREGERLGVPGFGELPIEGAEQDLDNINELLETAEALELDIFTTQDWHPKETAHFSQTPDFNTTWPIHCVANTPGAALHPQLNVPARAVRFYKGNERLKRGEDDTSYSGMNGFAFETNQPLPEWLEQREVSELVLAGEALSHCLKATALDARKNGLEVTVAIDATTPVTPEMARAAIDELEAAGVQFATTAEIKERLAATTA